MQWSQVLYAGRGGENLPKIRVKIAATRKFVLRSASQVISANKGRAAIFLRRLRSPCRRAIADGQRSPQAVSGDCEALARAPGDEETAEREAAPEDGRAAHDQAARRLSSL